MSLKKLYQSILPGIFLIGFNIGTGSVTAMAKAGANYGMSLLWTIVLSCLVTYYLINAYGRYTIITGETALQAFKKHIHPAVGIFFIVALTVNVSGSIMGVMGIVTDVLFVWSKQYFAGGIKPVTWTIFIIILIYSIFWFGNTKIFEKVLSVLVAIMGVSFLINFFILTPSLSEILRGLVPKVPKTGLISQTGGPFLVTASMVGTTVTSMMFIMRSVLVKEEGWTLKDLKIQKRDAIVSVSLMFIISASVMASSAGTLFKAGMGLERSSDMVSLLAPLAGVAASTIFVIGISAAGISSQFPNALITPWLLRDYKGKMESMKLPKYRIIVFVMLLLGLVVPLFHASPVFVMVASQAFGALVLPATVLCIFYLTNKKSIMGNYTNGKLDNVILSFILIFSLIMGGIGINGFLKDLFLL